LLTVTIGTDKIGCTANHPFWSEDRQEFVEAGHLQVGERVRTRLDEVAAVVSIKPRPPTAWVYNLEVQGEHVYEVGPNGTLVHNACLSRLFPGQDFVYLYRMISRAKREQLRRTRSFRYLPWVDTPTGKNGKWF